MLFISCVRTFSFFVLLNSNSVSQTKPKVNDLLKLIYLSSNKVDFCS